MKWLISAGKPSDWLGLHEASYTEAIKSCLGPGDVFWDIGAGFGYHTLLASRIVGNEGAVYSFSPGPEREGLLQHLNLNRTSNVTLVRSNPSLRQTTLDQWRESERPRLPRCIRIGMQSQEARILRGAVNLLEESRPILVLEAHPDGDIPSIAAYSAIRAVLQPLGYEIEAHFPESPRDPIFLIALP